MKKRAIAIVIATLVFMISIHLPAYAQEYAVKPGSPAGATVSEEVDRASGGDNDLATQYFMYIPSKLSSTDLPKMGDAGIDINMLLLITIGVGVIYLGCQHYAYRE